MKITIMYFFLILSAISFYGDAVFSGTGEKARLFILHSYEQDHVCGQPQHDGIVNGLNSRNFEEGVNLEIGVYYMDTKRKNNTPELMAAQAQKAFEAIERFQPDVLVTLDDNAFRTTALPLADKGIPIVFCGLNGQPEDYNEQKRFMNSRSHPGGSVTGVYEKLHVLDALRVHSKIFKGGGEVRFLVDESPTGKAILKQIRLELKETKPALKATITTIGAWEEYKAEIKSLNRNPNIAAIYPAALLLKDAKGVVYTAPEIFKWTVEHSKKPEIALNYAFTRLGLFGGAAVDFFAMGVQAGEKAAAVLSGVGPGDIPIDDAERYALVFNMKRAACLGIDIPEDILMAADEVIR